MAKPFLFAMFSIGCLLAQALCGRLYAENNQLELSESTSFPDCPFLSCVLLQSVSACSETCSLIGSIYGYPITSGICGEFSECVCNILPKASLEVYWNKKFDGDSTNVLEEILKDGALSKKVLAVLKTPFQTYQQTISALKPLLNEEQLKNLHPKDKEAQNIFVADDKFKAVEEYVEKNVKPKQFADGNETKKYLSSVIRSADGAYSNRIYQEVCRSQNVLLIEALNERSGSRGSGSGACSRKEDEGNVIRLIDIAAVNKLIKLPSNEPSNRSDSSTELKKAPSTARSSSAKDVEWNRHSSLQLRKPNSAAGSTTAKGVEENTIYSGPKLEQPKSTAGSSTAKGVEKNTIYSGHKLELSKSTAGSTTAKGVEGNTYSSPKLEKSNSSAQSSCAKDVEWNTYYIMEYLREILAKLSIFQ